MCAEIFCASFISSRPWCLIDTSMLSLTVHGVEPLVDVLNRTSYNTLSWHGFTNPHRHSTSSSFLLVLLRPPPISSSSSFVLVRVPPSAFLLFNATNKRPSSEQLPRGHLASRVFFCGHFKTDMYARRCGPIFLLQHAVS